MTASNRFARGIDQLEGQERAAAEAVVEAARATFSDFADKPDSTYYRTANTGPEETWQRITVELGRVCVLAAHEGRRDVRLHVEDIAQIHRAIFEPVLGPLPNPFRGTGVDVQYPVMLGTPERPVQSVKRGVRYKQIGRRLREALERFEAELEELAELNRQGRLTIQRAVDVALKLYVSIIRIHPFVDGNGRTAWAVFAYAMARSDLPLVALRPTPETRWALGTALRSGGKQDFAPLAEIVVETIRASTP